MSCLVEVPASLSTQMKLLLWVQQYRYTLLVDCVKGAVKPLLSHLPVGVELLALMFIFIVCDYQVLFDCAE